MASNDTATPSSSTQVFDVQGMTCGHCERAVTEAVRSADPLATVRIDRSTGRVEVGNATAPRMVRHYESLGLLSAVARTDSGYRQYSEADVHTLHFIRRSRDLGFSMEEIAGLLALWHDRTRASIQVKRIAQAHIDDLSERIAAMQSMQRSLQTLVSCCKGNDRPDCPILDDLAAGQPEQNAPKAARKTLPNQ